MLNVVRTTEALRDAAEIWRYLADYDEAVADRLIDQISDRLQMLSALPYTGRSREELGSSLRSHPAGKYLIFYRVTAEAIIVIRILHGARNLRRIFRRKH